eukprot:PhF_6_TR30195/c0_g2_i2/m.44368
MIHILSFIICFVVHNSITANGLNVLSESNNWTSVPLLPFFNTTLPAGRNRLVGIDVVIPGFFNATGIPAWQCFKAPFNATAVWLKFPPTGKCLSDPSEWIETRVNHYSESTDTQVDNDTIAVAVHRQPNTALECAQDPFIEAVRLTRLQCVCPNVLTQQFDVIVTWFVDVVGEYFDSPDRVFFSTRSFCAPIKGDVPAGLGVVLSASQNAFIVAHSLDPKFVNPAAKLDCAKRNATHWFWSEQCLTAKNTAFYDMTRNVSLLYTNFDEPPPIGPESKSSWEDECLYLSITKWFVGTCDREAINVNLSVCMSIPTPQLEISGKFTARLDPPQRKQNQTTETVKKTMIRSTSLNAAQNARQIGTVGFTGVAMVSSYATGSMTSMRLTLTVVSVENMQCVADDDEDSSLIEQWALSPVSVIPILGTMNGSLHLYAAMAMWNAIVYLVVYILLWLVRHKFTFWMKYPSNNVNVGLWLASGSVNSIARYYSRNSGRSQSDGAPAGSDFAFVSLFVCPLIVYAHYMYWIMLTHRNVKMEYVTNVEVLQVSKRQRLLGFLGEKGTWNPQQLRLMYGVFCVHKPQYMRFGAFIDFLSDQFICLLGGIVTTGVGCQIIPSLILIESVLYITFLVYARPHSDPSTTIFTAGTSLGHCLTMTGLLSENSDCQSAGIMVSSICALLAFVFVGIDILDDLKDSKGLVPTEHDPSTHTKKFNQEEE